MTLLCIIYFFGILPAWFSSASVHLWSMYKRNRVADLVLWQRWDLIHHISQVTTMLLGLAVGFLGAEVYRQW